MSESRRSVLSSDIFHVNIRICRAEYSVGAEKSVNFGQKYGHRLATLLKNAGEERVKHNIR